MSRAPGLYHIFCLVLFITVIFGASLNNFRYGRPRRRYDGHEVLRVQTQSPYDVQILKAIQKRDLQIEFWSTPSVEQRPVDILVAPQDSHILRLILKSNGLQYHVIVPNVQDAIDKQTNFQWGDGNTPSDGFDFGDYHTWEEIVTWLGELAAANSDLVTIVTLGQTVEGRPIEMVKISASSGEVRPGVWLDAGIHSNEWIGPATMLYFIRQLVSGYVEGDRETMWLVDNLDWYILPIFNVDGYVYTWNKDRLWRKNRAVSGNGTCVGVDLNRNWPLHWGEGEADHDPCGRMYVGPEAVSEPETRAVVDFLRAHNDSLRAYLAYHSFSQYWMLPYSYTNEHKPEDYQELMNVSKLAVRALEQVHGTHYIVGRISELIGEASGASVDYTYSTLGIKYSFGIELRDDGRHGTLLPSDQIIPNAEESWVAAKEIAFIIIDKIYEEEGYSNI